MARVALAKHQGIVHDVGGGQIGQFDAANHATLWREVVVASEGVVADFRDVARFGRVFSRFNPTEPGCGRTPQVACDGVLQVDVVVPLGGRGCRSAVSEEDAFGHTPNASLWDAGERQRDT